MTITLNGHPHPLSQPSTVLELLTALGLQGRPVVVELNQQALLPREHGITVVNDGAVIEIVQITAGG